MQKREHVKEIREKPADGELGEKLKEEEGKSNQKVKEQERMWIPCHRFDGRFKFSYLPGHFAFLLDFSRG